MRGLGVVMNQDGSYYVPDWCSWLPFSSFNDACKLPTPQQVRSNDMSNLGRNSDPARVAILQRQWAETEQTMCRENPEECAAYNFAMDHPTLSAALGTGSTVRAVSDAVEDLASCSLLGLSCKTLAVIGAGLLGAALFMKGRR